ncbi:myo-inositol-1-phosphate synthase [Staphylococcus ursi]|uniref:inositol-3-phosphate synthase n=1 Tax=Staphylococcus sp. MI 10-1553 TaxID=1912064 RepID=UPI001398978D|nr:myo-inositol-1-phosphate synthase [Staphylococcus sp. MI 10-1553]QHW35914.1 myo-inositol-1-phosphate synthase [Staphylococcus sp. MI 10-1553]
MKVINVGIAGVGNCASSFVQLIEGIKSGKLNNHEGIMFESIGGYKCENVNFTSAFDIDTNKINKDLSEAIYQSPNNSVNHVDVSKINTIVTPGILNNRLPSTVLEKININEECNEVTVDDIAKSLVESKTQVLICYLPTGSEKDVKSYALAAAKANTAFINCTPELVSRDTQIRDIFIESNIPLLGDDMRSHMGATTLHTALIELLHSRGIEINNTYQLNFGGNMDFLNLSDSSRNRSKQISKKNALFSAGIDATNVSAGPNGYIEYLNDTKVCYLRIEGTSILGSKIAMETKLEVEDSPNSAGVIANAVRIAKVAIDKKLGINEVEETCAFLFKSPVKGKKESESLDAISKFIERVEEKDE